MNNFTQETVDKVLTDALNLPSMVLITDVIRSFIDTRQTEGAEKKSFVQLGGDSLSAVKFVNLLNNALSIKVPAPIFSALFRFKS